MEVHGSEASTSAESVEAGIFTWDIPADRLYADSAVADHFGLDRCDTENGLPLERYVARVHPDDKAALSKAIRFAIALSEPYQSHYRTERLDGSWSEVIAFGRCFYGPDGNPSHFSGIIYPMPSTQEGDNSVLWHLFAAHDIATRKGDLSQARQIIELLKTLD
jgi:PAS domain-containing protein